MSLSGRLASKLGLRFDGPTVIFDSPVIFNGGIFGGLGQGKVYFVDPANGSDNSNGRTPSTAKITLLAGYNLLTANQHDTLVLIGGATQATISDQLDWAKNYTHLVGIAAPTPNTRARIGNSGNSSANNALLLVSATGCMFTNFRILQNSATAACHAIEVTGDRNYFDNVNMQGQVNTTASTGAESSSLKLNGAEEFRFKDCIIGTVTGAVRTAGGVLMLDGNCGKGEFLNCKFHSVSETVGAEIINYVDATAVDRSINFDDCEFYNFSPNHVTVLDEVLDMFASPQSHDMIFKNPTLVGITEIDSTASPNVWVTGPVAVAGTAGVGQSGVAVHPT